MFSLGDYDEGKNCRCQQNKPRVFFLIDTFIVYYGSHITILSRDPHNFRSDLNILCFLYGFFSVYEVDIRCVFDDDIRYGFFVFKFGA